MVELGKRRLGAIAASAALSAIMILLVACPNPFFDRVKDVVNAAKAPQVALSVGSVVVKPGDLFDFGTVTVNTTSSKVFTITNSGKSDLGLSGGSSGISIGGTNADQFSLTAIPALTVIHAGNNSTFTLSFAPTSVGVKSASVTVGSNDPLAAAYTFAVKGSSTSGGAAVQAPIFPTASGRIGWHEDVSISIVTPGSQIAYTIDGSIPSTNGTGGIINGIPIATDVGFPLPFGTTLVNAVAYKAGFPDSVIVTRTYTKQEFLYALSRTAGTLTVYSLDPDTGALSLPSTTNYGAPLGGMAIDATGQFLYVTDPSSGGQVWGYSINPLDGGLTWIGNQPVTSPGPISIVANGDVVYVASTTTSVLSSFDKNGSGNLSGTWSIFTGSDPVSMAVDVYARFMYVSSEADSSIFGYVLDASRHPTTYDPGTPYGLATGVRRLLIDPTGSWLYVSNSDTTISGFAINPANGELTPMPTPQFTTLALDPDEMAIDPTGSFLYVTNPLTNYVELFQITAGSGFLTGDGVYPTGLQPEGVRVDPSGRFLFVADSGDNTISMFPISPADGHLGLPSTTSTIPAGAPWDILITGTP